MFGKKEPAPTEEHFRKWTQTRSRGVLYYVLTRGILLAIVGELVGFLIFEVWSGHRPLNSFRPFSLDGFVGLVIAGAINGSMEWGSNEKRYGRELLEFSSANYESPEQTLKGLQQGMVNVSKH